MREWHDALGHVDTRVLQEMASSQAVDGFEIINEKLHKCTDCAAGKATRTSHTRDSSIQVEQVGDLVYIDLVGPIASPSLDDSKYMVVATDMFSHYVWVNPLASKDQVATILQWFVGEFEAISGKKIRTVLTDNGSEFINNEVITLLAVEHIRMIQSAPYTPEQNGASERSNRTILETARTLIVQSGLSTILRSEAVVTAACIRNCLSKRGKKVTPLELFQNRKPFVGHLVRFGTPVQSLINDRRIEKFDAKTESAFVVGFTDRTNTYRLYLPRANKVIKTCHVIFRGHGSLSGRVGEVDNGPEAATFSMNLFDIEADGSLVNNHVSPAQDDSQNIQPIYGNLSEAREDRCQSNEMTQGRMYQGQVTANRYQLSLN